jgi:hypothetical protein
MGLEGGVGVAEEGEDVLTDMVGFGEAGIDIAKFERRRSVHVLSGALTVDERAIVGEGLIERDDVVQWLICNVY